MLIVRPFHMPLHALNSQGSIGAKFTRDRMTCSVSSEFGSINIVRAHQMHLQTRFVVGPVVTYSAGKRRFNATLINQVPL